MIGLCKSFSRIHSIENPVQPKGTLPLLRLSDEIEIGTVEKCGSGLYGIGRERLILRLLIGKAHHMMSPHGRDKVEKDIPVH